MAWVAVWASRLFKSRGYRFHRYTCGGIWRASRLPSQVLPEGGPAAAGLRALSLLFRWDEQRAAVGTATEPKEASRRKGGGGGRPRRNQKEGGRRAHPGQGLTGAQPL